MARLVAQLPGVYVARWPGGPVARWSGGLVARWPDGPVVRWQGALVACFNALRAWQELSMIYLKLHLLISDRHLICKSLAYERNDI